MLLSGPQTELEADEAIVGLMARHILEGERPTFYYMQPYMGSLEAYLAAATFALFGSSPFTLKIVPLLGSLLFVALIYVTGYRLGGFRVALASGLYVAVPPAFLALWGLKARGGYVETLVMGQLLILIALEVGKRRRVEPGSAVALGLISGLGLWTNPLIIVYILPVAAYLGLVLRERIKGKWLSWFSIAAAVGALPLLEYNLREGFATGGAMLGGGGSAADAPAYLYRFFRHTLPVMVGLAQASSSPGLFWPAFREGPAGMPPVAVAVASLYILLVLLNLPRLLALVRKREEGADPRSLLSLLLVALPVIFVLSKFRELVTEPRYLLPLYSAAPLLAAGLASYRVVSRRISAGMMVALVLLNLYSLGSLRPELNLPDTAMGSTTANRAELAGYLSQRGLQHIYTDYWIAYPIAFESREQIVPSVVSGGFNRYIPYAYRVSVSPNPAFVFVSGSPGDTGFLERLRERGIQARKHSISVYSVYSDVDPLNLARP